MILDFYGSAIYELHGYSFMQCQFVVIRVDSIPNIDPFLVMRVDLKNNVLHTAIPCDGDFSKGYPGHILSGALRDVEMSCNGEILEREHDFKEIEIFLYDTDYGEFCIRKQGDRIAVSSNLDKWAYKVFDLD